MVGQGLFLVFRVEGQRFCLHTDRVASIVEYRPLTPIPLLPDYARGAFDHLGETVGVVSLRRKLHIADGEDRTSGCFVLVRRAENLLGLWVDAVDEVLDETAGTWLQAPAGAMSALFPRMLSHDRDLILELDLEALLNREDTRYDPQALTAAAHAAATVAAATRGVIAEAAVASVEPGPITQASGAEVVFDTATEAASALEVEPVHARAAEPAAQVDADVGEDAGHTVATAMDFSSLIATYSANQATSTSAEEKSHEAGVSSGEMQPGSVAVEGVSERGVGNRSIGLEAEGEGEDREPQLAVAHTLRYRDDSSPPVVAVAPQALIGAEVTRRSLHPARVSQAAVVVVLVGAAVWWLLHPPENSPVDTTSVAVTEQPPVIAPKADVTVELPGHRIVIKRQDPTPAPPSPTRIRHIVVAGDTLWFICKRYLGNPFLYPEVARLSQIRNPDLIYPGNVVYIEQVDNPPRR